MYKQGKRRIVKQQRYKEISRELLEQAYKNAWSMESMAAHGAEGRKTEYVGTCIKGNAAYDYYRDSAGAWWYKRRGIVGGGQIVNMDVIIFGKTEKEIKKERWRRWSNENST